MDVTKTVQDAFPLANSSDSHCLSEVYSEVQSWIVGSIWLADSRLDNSFDLKYPYVHAPTTVSTAATIEVT